MKFLPSSNGRLVVDTEKSTIFEFAPQIRLIVIRGVAGGAFEHDTKLTLAYPYTQFIFKKWPGWKGYCSLHLAFTNEPVEDEESIVFFPPMLNVYAQTHQVCLGAGFSSRILTYQQVIDNYWMTMFHDNGNTTYWPCYSLLKKLPMENFQGWQTMTREQGLSFVLDVDWPLPTTINEILKNRERQNYTCFSIEEEKE